MIIDGHAHSCGEFFEPECIITGLDELKVDKVVLCPGVKNGPGKYNFIPGFAAVLRKADIMLGINKTIRLLAKIQKPGDLLTGNEYVYSLQLQHPDRIIQFFWADPTSEEIEAHLHQKFAAWGFKGIKVHQCTQKSDCTSPGLDVVINFAREKEIPVFIHLWSPGEVRKFMATAQKNPEVNFIIAHLIGLETLIKHKATLNNIYFDISPAPLISSQRISMAVDNFGADKVILGSDTPFGKNNLRKNIQKVTQLKISLREKELILGENLRRILKI